MARDPKPRYTVEQYLEMEEQSDRRHEYQHGEIFLMSGGSFAHNQIIANISRSLGNQLEQRPCNVLTTDMRVKVSATELYTYPDIVVVCDRPRLEIIKGLETLLNPVLIVEVLSKTTEAYDKGPKFDNYRSLDSLQEYLLIAQDRPHVMLYTRQPGEWLLSEIDNSQTGNSDINNSEIDNFAGVIELSLVSSKLALTEIYRLVQFQPELPPGMDS